MLLLTVFGLGVFFTSLPLRAYLSDSGTYYYLAKCATLISGVSDRLPGVFHDNPYRDSINGSLWSMHYEIQMYAILTVIWVIVRMIARIPIKLFERLIVTGAAGAGVLFIARHFFYLPVEITFVRLLFMFFSGAAFYVLKKWIILSHSLFRLFVIALLSSAIVNTHAFFLVYTLTIAYVLFYMAYIPSGWIRNYNAVGDYSYGVYIYAFPVQQTVAALIPGVSVSSMLFISAAIALLLGALSWHLLERHALALKRPYADHTKKMLNFGRAVVVKMNP